MVEPGSVAIGTLATIAGISGYGAMKMNSKLAKDIQSQVNQQCKANDLLLKETDDARRIAEEAKLRADQEVEKLKQEVAALQTQKETLAKAAKQLQATITNAPVAQVAPPAPDLLSMIGMESAPAPAPAPTPAPAPAAPVPEPEPVVGFAPTPEPAPAVVTGTPVSVVGETPLQKFVRENQNALRFMREERERKKAAIVAPLPPLPSQPTETEREAFDMRVAQRERKKAEWKADMDNLDRRIKEGKERTTLPPLVTPDDRAIVEELKRQIAEEEAEQRKWEEDSLDIEEYLRAEAAKNAQNTATAVVTGSTTPSRPSSTTPFGFIDRETAPEPSVLAAASPAPASFAALPEIAEELTPTTLGTKVFPIAEEDRVAFPPPPQSSAPPFALPPPSSTIPFSKPIDATLKTRRTKPSPPTLPKLKTRRVDVKPAPAPEPEPEPLIAEAPAVVRPFGRTPPTNIPGKWPTGDTLRNYEYTSTGQQQRVANAKRLAELKKEAIQSTADMKLDKNWSPPNQKRLRDRLAEIQEEMKTLKGGLRKKKLRTRRGVKQNVRRSRSGKNRANRSASHTRRRS